MAPAAGHEKSKAVGAGEPVGRPCKGRRRRRAVRAPAGREGAEGDVNLSGGPFDPGRSAQGAESLRPFGWRVGQPWVACQYKDK
jgi:hypothetical protein